MSRKSFVALAAAAALLSGCLVPEKFNAKADFSADGSYSFTYKGTAVNALAAMMIHEQGKLGSKDEAAMQQEADKLKRNPDVQSVSYKGNGRYELALDAKRKKGQKLDMLGIMHVTTDKDGVITISSAETKEKDKAELGKLGLKVDGTLEVVLPKNAEVLSHNATSTPKVFGLVGGYAWKIGDVGARPVMKIRLKA